MAAIITALLIGAALGFEISKRQAPKHGEDHSPLPHEMVTHPETTHSPPEPTTA